MAATTITRRILPAWAALVLAGCAGPALLPPPPVRPNGLALWRIIHDQCVPGERARHDPAPCAATAGSLTETFRTSASAADNQRVHLAA